MEEQDDIHRLSQVRFDPSTTRPRSDLQSLSLGGLRRDWLAPFRAVPVAQAIATESIKTFQFKGVQARHTQALLGESISHDSLPPLPSESVLRLCFEATENQLPPNPLEMEDRFLAEASTNHAPLVRIAHAAFHVVAWDVEKDKAPRFLRKNRAANPWIESSDEYLVRHIRDLAVARSLKQAPEMISPDDRTGPKTAAGDFAQTFKIPSAGMIWTVSPVVTTTHTPVPSTILESPAQVTEADPEVSETSIWTDSKIDSSDPTDRKMQLYATAIEQLADILQGYDSKNFGYLLSQGLTIKEIELLETVRRMTTKKSRFHET